MQLADLHDRICLLTSTMVRKDGDKIDESTMENQSSLETNYEILNRRIAALQRQISDKHTKADKKILDMKKLLRKEQAELIKISDLMNRERKRNFTINGSPCWRNNCMAECSQH